MRIAISGWRPAGLLLFCCALLLLAAPLSHGQQTARAKELGAQLKCVCGCNQVLTACNHVGCQYSHAMLKELDERVARGDSDSLILQSFVQEYGEQVLPSPPKGLQLVGVDTSDRGASAGIFHDLGGRAALAPPIDPRASRWSRPCARLARARPPRERGKRN